jgi:hypothetical protein
MWAIVVTRSASCELSWVSLALSVDILFSATIAMTKAAAVKMNIMVPPRPNLASRFVGFTPCGQKSQSGIKFGGGIVAGDDAGEGENIDMGGTGALERLCGGDDCGTGGVDIIDQGDALADDLDAG